jgi:DNA-binding PadR family transcriptional regulator
MKEDKRGRTFKGIISLIILKSLWNAPGYGYQLEREVNKGLNQKLSNGEIYSILRNMEIRGLIKNRNDSQPGRNRKYYEISGDGKKYLLNQALNMDLAINTMQEIIKFVHSVSEKEKY